ncbi:hypothetical protein CWN35_15665, partial [Klebsiella pneumoniae]
RSLREDPVGRISVAPSGTKAGMAPVVSSPAALRLPGLGYRTLREDAVGRIRRSRHPAQRQVWRRRCPARRRCACRVGEWDSAERFAKKHPPPSNRKAG